MRNLVVKIQWYDCPKCGKHKVWYTDKLYVCDNCDYESEYLPEPTHKAKQ